MILKAAAAVALMAILGAPTPSEQPVKTGIGTRYYGGAAPARFVKEGPVVVFFVAPERLYEACGLDRIPGLTLRGCTRWTKEGVPVVFVPHPTLDPDPTNWFVLGHELGHSAGWSGDHPA